LAAGIRILDLEPAGKQIDDQRAGGARGVGPLAF